MPLRFECALVQNNQVFVTTSTFHFTLPVYVYEEDYGSAGTFNNHNWAVRIFSPLPYYKHPLYSMSRKTVLLRQYTSQYPDYSSSLRSDIIVEIHNYRGYEKWRIPKETAQNLDGTVLIPIVKELPNVPGGLLHWGISTSYHELIAREALRVNAPLRRLDVYRFGGTDSYIIVGSDDFGTCYWSRYIMGSPFLTVDGVTFVQFTYSNPTRGSPNFPGYSYIGSGYIPPLIWRATIKGKYPLEPMLDQQGRTIGICDTLPSLETNVNKGSNLLLSDVGELVERQLNDDYDASDVRLIHFGFKAVAVQVNLSTNFLMSWQRRGNFDYIMRCIFDTLQTTYTTLINWASWEPPSDLFRAVDDVEVLVPFSGYHKVYELPLELRAADDVVPVLKNNADKIKAGFRIDDRTAYILLDTSKDIFEDKTYTVNMTPPITLKFKAVKPFDNANLSLQRNIFLPSFGVSFVDLPEGFVLKAFSTDLNSFDNATIDATVPPNWNYGEGNPRLIKVPKHQFTVIRHGRLPLSHVRFFTESPYNGWIAMQGTGVGQFYVVYLASPPTRVYLMTQNLKALRGAFYGYQRFGGCRLYQFTMRRKLFGEHFILLVGRIDDIAGVFYRGDIVKVNVFDLLRFGADARRLTTGIDGSGVWSRPDFSLTRHGVESNRPFAFWQLLCSDVNPLETLTEPYRSAFRGCWGEWHPQVPCLFAYFRGDIAEAFNFVILGINPTNGKNRCAFIFWRIFGYDVLKGRITELSQTPEIVEFDL